jgi:hypothetical protein
MSFEANTGQTDQRVKFLARGEGYSLFLTPTEAVLSMVQGVEPAHAPRSTKKPAAENFYGPKSPAQIAHERDEQKRREAKERLAQSRKPRGFAVLRMKLRGANNNARISGVQRLANTSNYLNGSDAKKWRTNVAHYARVNYKSVYPGIDMVYYGTGQKLEYDFLVAPGADPNRIKLNFDGANSVRVNRSGDLVLGIGKESIVQHAPVVYQELGGRRQRVAGQYAVSRTASGNIEVGFRLAAYDKQKPLVIDPVLSYLTYVGGSGEESGNGAFAGTGLSYADASGNMLISGTTASVNFPTTTGAYERIKAGDEFSDDIFITKLNSTGGAIFSTYLGGDSYEYINAASYVPDNSGNIQLEGSTSSFDFPTTSGAFQSTLGDDGLGDIFITRLNATGTALIYSTLLGGDGSEYGSTQFLPSGEVLVTGSTSSTDFPTTSGAYDRTYGGGINRYGFGPADDIFLTKLNSTGGAVFSTYLGGTGDDRANVINDGANGFILQGTTRCTNFPTTTGAFDRTYGGDDDLILCKLNATGSALEFSTFFGGSGEDVGYFYLTEAGYILGSGNTPSEDFPTTTNAYDRIYNGGFKDAWVAKFSTSGVISFSTLLGGNGDEDLAYAFAQPDSSGNLLYVGKTSSSNFPTTTGAFDRTHGGFDDLFVAKLNATGSSLLFSSYFGGNGVEVGFGQVDSSGNILLTGTTSSSNLSVSNAVQSSYGGGTDAFAAKLNPTASGLVFSTYLGGSNSETNGTIFGGSTDGSILLAGITKSANFPVSTTAIQKTFGGIDDVYVTKLSATGAMIFSTYFGGNAAETAYAQPLDSGTIVLSGETSSTNGLPLKNALQTAYGGGETDMFVAKLSSSGTLLYSTYLGGNGDDNGFALSENSGAVYIVGSTTSSNLPTTSSAFRRTFGGETDVFAAKIVDGPGESSDTTVPTVAVSTPANSSGIKALTAISGTSADNTGGSGIARVAAYLRRTVNGAYEYWALRSGVWGWGTSATPIPTTLGSNGAWSVSNTSPAGTTLPSGTSLPSGTYQAFAYAYDKAGNSKISAVNTFLVDTVVPSSVVVTTPANSSGIKALTAISGTSADNTGGSGIARVAAYLRRTVNGAYEYWALRSGVWGWGTSATPIPTTLASSGAWSVSNTSPAGTNLPSGTTNLPSGTYQAFAYAYDKAGNYKSSAVNTFLVDTVVPTSVVVTTPANAGTVATLSAISGTSADNAGGSGLGKVDAYLRRTVNGAYQYWANRSGVWGWGTSATPIPTTLATNGAWSVSNTSPAGTNLPSGTTNLPSGTYQAFAYAYDKANNSKLSAINTFSVKAGGAQAQAETSPVALSSASAKADGTIQLVFTGALNRSALNVGNYAASQNNAVEIVSVQQPDATTVVLSTNELATGQPLDVAYNVQDAQGRTLSGTAKIIVR